MPLRSLREALGSWTPGGAVAADPLHAIASAWPAIVGVEIAKNAQPRAINGTALLIVTRSSAWSQQLQFLSMPILRALADVGGGHAIETLRFRIGSVRERGGRPAGAGTARERSLAGPPPLAPAADAREAFERLRRRVRALRRAAAAECPVCGAPAGAAGRACAPCAQTVERERRVRLERLIYAAPWLPYAEVRAQFPDATLGEYEAARRALLGRWWLVLERLERAPKAIPTKLERMVASSYVLLHTRTAPDRLTPAVVRNLIGAQLEARLWPQGADKASGADSSK